MSIYDDIEAFKAGRLDLSCIEMSLVQESAAVPVTYRGKGSLRHDDSKELAVTLYASETTNTDWGEDAGPRDTIRIGFACADYTLHESVHRLSK